MTDAERQKDGERTDILRENGETERGSGGREGIRDGEKKKEADRQTNSCWAITLVSGCVITASSKVH